ncbi:DUF177 domain-containing protein [Pusillimonas sp. TS35]|uniref:YceD family protein n=1 Tax=Paracandidimonas lactea TaxID=2895524 RepID=UPI00137048E9|nr:YceD family protein [Paracandidimonas lactea]MYN13703.1 DUF177 domain-containing protein [Pusillimonas sp. TS35]
MAGKNTVNGGGKGGSATRYADSVELARLGREVQGEAPLAGFARLLQGLPEQAIDAQVSWSVRGSADAQGRLWLHVAAQAAPCVVCQRCMQPFACTLHAENTLELMKSESELQAREAHDDGTDSFAERIVGASRQDLLELVEDELILALPYVPKHDVCPSLPEPLTDTEGGQPARPSPFAVLGKFKKD